MMTSATSAAATVTGDCRKLHHKSLSKIRRSGDADRSAAAEDASSANADSLAVDPKARIDKMIEQVDDEVDRDKKEADQSQIGSHDWDVGKGHCLDEHQAHARPLKDGLGDDGKGDDRAELETGNSYHWYQRVLESVPEIDRPVGQSARPREFDVVGAQYLDHLGTDQPHDQGHLKQRQGHGWQDDRSPAIEGNETRAPPAELDNAAPAEGRQPAEDDCKYQDEQDADQERRQRDADQREPQQQL